MNIRAATEADRDGIRKLHLAAFDASENSLVAELAVSLLAEATTPPTLSFVAEIEAEIVGHVAFSPATAEHDPSFTGYTLAPLGVSPDRQKSGIGSKLVEHGIETLSKSGADVLLVYGDPKYYGQFGFSVPAAERYLPPYPLQYPFGWQALEFEQSAVPDSKIQIDCVASLRNPELW